MLTSLGLLLVVATAAFVAWPLLSPAALKASPRIVATTNRNARRELELARHKALAAIREAEFDLATGKLSDEDYAVLRAELEQNALAVLAVE